MAKVPIIKTSGKIGAQGPQGAGTVGSGESLKSTYTQSSHGFVAGDVVSFYNNAWVLANSNDGNRLGRWIVESVPNANSFVAVFSGLIQVSSWNLIPGSYYMVGSGGDLVEYLGDDDPNFQYDNPILQALTVNSGHVLPWRPSDGGSESSISGSQGIQGPQGPSYSGEGSGAQGPTGPQGVAGVQGTAGSNGTNGAQGPTGPQGVAGVQGTAGSNGTNGAQGQTGPQGVAGVQGRQGFQGAGATLNGTTNNGIATYNSTSGALDIESELSWSSNCLTVGGSCDGAVLAGSVQFQNTSAHYISSIGQSGSTRYQVPSGESHAFWVSSSQVASINSTGICGDGSQLTNLNYNNISNPPSSVSLNGTTNNGITTYNSTTGVLDVESSLLWNSNCLSVGGSCVGSILAGTFQFQNTSGHYISSVGQSGSTRHQVPSGQAHTFWVASSQIVSMSSTGVTLSLNEYADNNAAFTAGVPVGGLYHTGGTVKIVTVAS